MRHFDSSVSIGTAGPGFLGWLTLLFIALKLTGYIHWTWLWVLSPLWIPCAILATILLAGLVFILCTAILESASK